MQATIRSLTENSAKLETLEQRNKYLRQIKEEHRDEKFLEIWDEKLAEYAEKILEINKTNCEVGE